jgi:hypothetical protein
MIRAASIPHLGQTTPTAALGLRAIRSLLTRLDADWPPTVLCTAFRSATPRICPLVSGIESFLSSKPSIFPINSKTCKNPPRVAARLTLHLWIRRSTSRHFRHPSICRFPPLRAWFDTFVTSGTDIDVIVGTLLQGRRMSKCQQTELATHWGSAPGAVAIALRNFSIVSGDPLKRPSGYFLCRRMSA